MNAHHGQPVSVYIVEDAPEIRMRLTRALEDLENVEIVGEAEAAPAAVAGILAAHPDCVVLDVQLAEGTGLEVLQAVHPREPDVEFIVLTNHATEQYRRLYTAAGAHWFLDKTNEFARVPQAIASVHPRH